MTRILAFLALPFVLLGMVVAPLLGLHFCPQEALPLLAGAATLPFIGPAVKALIARLKRSQATEVHCCEPKHQETLTMADVEESFGAARKADRVIAINGKCNFPGCHMPYPGPGHAHWPPLIEDDWCDQMCGTDYPHRNADHTK